MQRRAVEPEQPEAVEPAADVPDSDGPTAPNEPTTVAEPTAADRKDSVEEMLGRLSEVSEVKANETVSTDLVSEVSTHTDSLRATVNAQQQAQRLLELANKERSEASAQSEQILLEAKAMAERVQKEADEDAARVQRETQEWAKDQRKAIETLVADLTGAATAEADAIREEAMSAAKDEAASFASLEKARHRAAAEKDADIIRGRARAQLEKANGALGDVQESVIAFNESITTLVKQLRAKSAAIEKALKDPALSTPGEETSASDVTDEDLARILSEPVIPHPRGDSDDIESHEAAGDSAPRPSSTDRSARTPKSRS